MGYAHGRQWTDAEVENQLRSIASSLGGRMPSNNELKARGMNALACRITRTGGWRHWARRAGFSTKASCTEMGQRWEDYVEGVLKLHGFQVERQNTRAPFDILVNGKARVNVKSARWREYGSSKGFFFGIGSTWKECDVFALVKVTGSHTPEVLWVPSQELRQQTLTLTVRNKFNARTSMEVLSTRVERR